MRFRFSTLQFRRCAAVLLPAAGLAVVVSACRSAPEEVVHDAGPTAPVATAPAASSAQTAAAAPIPDGGAGDGGLSEETHAFCTDSYSADNPRLEKVCSPTDLFLPEGMTRRAAKICGEDFDEALSRGRASFDHDAAAHCLQMLQSGPMTRTSEADTFFAHFPCDRVLIGLAGEGQACRFSVECKDGLACEGYSVGVDGTCRKPPKVGAACTGQRFSSILNEAVAEKHHPACTGDAWCDGKTCQPHVASGKPCPGPLACGGGQSCVVGRCGKLGGAGAPCTTPSDCTLNSWCDHSADAGIGVCADKLPAGAVCRVPEACKGRCDFPKEGEEAARKIGHCAEVCGSG